MKGGLLGWEIYLWVLAGAESLLVWGILAGWTEVKVFLVARLKRSTIDWCGFFAIFYFFGGGGVYKNPEQVPYLDCVYIPSPHPSAHVLNLPTHPPPHQSPHSPPTLSTPKNHTSHPLPPSSQPPRLTYLPISPPPPSSTAPPPPRNRKRNTHTYLPPP